MAERGCSAEVVVYDQEGAQLVDFGLRIIPGTGWIQLNDIVPSAVEHAYATVAPADGCPIWAYASVIEEASGDPTTFEVRQETEISLGPGGLRPGFFIPWADVGEPNRP
jgi:hypothetical protein